MQKSRSSLQPLSFTAGKSKHSLNPSLTGFVCIRCHADLVIKDYFEGCLDCLASGQPSSVRSSYQSALKQLSDVHERGMRRYAAWMPYSSWVSLGEGGTSCVSFPVLADEVGSSAIYIKNEGQNPSGSHKDRANCLAVTRALDIGATKIVAASSGNAGASLALYASAAGLQCCVVTTAALSPVFRRAIEICGADIVTAPESLVRWQIVSEMVKSQDWFPATNYLDPPVGSNHFGTDGLKTIAFEIFEELGTVKVGAVLVPTSRGDLIWALYDGFIQLKDMGLLRDIPRLYAVEPFARLHRVLHGDKIIGSYPGTSNLSSIGGSTVTYQAVKAIRASGGGAVVVDDLAVALDQQSLARSGCYAELSSAAALTGLKTLLKNDMISKSETVVLIATSNGYKDSLSVRDQ